MRGYGTPSDTFKYRPGQMWNTNLSLFSLPACPQPTRMRFPGLGERHPRPNLSTDSESSLTSSAEIHTLPTPCQGAPSQQLTSGSQGWDLPPTILGDLEMCMLTTYPSHWHYMGETRPIGRSGRGRDYFSD